MFTVWAWLLVEAVWLLLATPDVWACEFGVHCLQMVWPSCPAYLSPSTVSLIGTHPGVIVIYPPQATHW